MAPSHQGVEVELERLARPGWISFAAQESIALSPLASSDSSSSIGAGRHGTGVAEASSVRSVLQLLCSRAILSTSCSIRVPQEPLLCDRQDLVIEKQC